jgi:hypothetical protein
VGVGPERVLAVLELTGQLVAQSARCPEATHVPTPTLVARHGFHTPGARSTIRPNRPISPATSKPEQIDRRHNLQRCPSDAWTRRICIVP